MTYHGVFGALSKLIDLVLPPTCSRCGTQVLDAQTLCGGCWSTMTFLRDPQCDACGHPFDYEVAERALCGACVREQPPFQKARAALLYDDHSRELVLGFKHADKTERAKLFAKWMLAAGHDVVTAADVIVPVPLHWTRLFQRRYNQAALLAHGLGRLSGNEVLADALVRKRKTPSQGRLGRLARARNVQGAFIINPRRQTELQDKRILLIDDVMTTGSTLNACTKILLRGGVEKVDVLTLARVVQAKTD